MKRSPLLRILTNSERNTFACERRWFFRYVLGLITGHNPAPLRHGDLWHRILAALYRSMQQVQAGQLERLPGAQALCEAIIGPWMDERLEYALTNDMPQETRDELLDEDREAAELMRLMFFGYYAAFADSDMERFEIVHVEAQAARALFRPRREPETMAERAHHVVIPRTLLTDTVMVSGKRRRRAWAYGGGMDLIVRDKRDGSHWLVEHKTTAETNLNKYKRKLYWDPQIKGYVWALRAPIAEVSEIKEPIHISGVIYNVARKKAPRVPELLKSGKALSKAAIDTTREIYLAEVLARGFNPDAYADMLEKLQNNVFFDRESIPISDAELEDFEHDVTAQALITIEAQKRHHHPRQASQCTGLNAGNCPYASTVCLNDGPMARKTFTTMTIRHAELRNEMAEPYVAQEDARKWGVAQNAIVNHNVERKPKEGSELTEQLSRSLTPSANTDKYPGEWDPFADGDQQS